MKIRKKHLIRHLSQNPSLGFGRASLKRSFMRKLGAVGLLAASVFVQSASAADSPSAAEMEESGRGCRYCSATSAEPTRCAYLHDSPVRG